MASDKNHATRSDERKCMFGCGKNMKVFFLRGPIVEPDSKGLRERERDSREKNREHGIIRNFEGGSSV